MKPLVSLREALSDDALLGTMLPGDSFATWRALLLASQGEELTAGELELFRARTGRDEAPDGPVEEMAFVAGRRSGKTAASATLSIYLSALCDWSDVFRRGERGVMLFLAQTQRTARVAFRYAEAAFDDNRMLAGLVQNKTQDTIELSTGVDLEIRPASFRGLRGLTVIGCIADELAYWFNDERSSNPDSEILGAVRPALATTGGPIILSSSPHAKKGELWEAYRRHYGPAGDRQILVAQGGSRDFNPTLPQRVIDRALERDEPKARAEYLGEFRDDLQSFIAIEAVQACVSTGVYERKRKDYTHYRGFCDPSGGNHDSMTLGIAHLEGDRAILDAIREVRPPFNPDKVVTDFCDLLKLYGCTSVTGDGYGAQWVETSFRDKNIIYVRSERNRSEIYLNALPLLNSKRADLLDSDRLVNQIAALERRTARGGRDTVDHPPSGSDDVANAALGALVEVAAKKSTYTLENVGSL